MGKRTRLGMEPAERMQSPAREQHSTNSLPRVAGS